MMTSHGAVYCEHTVRSNDEDRWLGAQYASPDARRKLLALHALGCELKRIPNIVSEPALGEIRLQWWREALLAILHGKTLRAHPVVEEIAITGVLKPMPEAQVDDVIDAAARPLYGEPFESAKVLAQWLETFDGAMDAMAVESLGGGEAVRRAAKKRSAAFAMAREGARLAPQIGDTIAAHVRTVIEETAVVLNTAPGETAPALLHLSLTGLYLRRGAGMFPIAKRLRLFTAMAFGRF